MAVCHEVRVGASRHRKGTETLGKTEWLEFGFGLQASGLLVCPVAWGFMISSLGEQTRLEVACYGIGGVIVSVAHILSVGELVSVHQG